jgi:hypothetical protein
LIWINAAACLRVQVGLVETPDNQIHGMEIIYGEYSSRSEEVCARSRQCT